MTPALFLFETVEVSPPLSLPYQARVFMSRSLWRYFQAIEARHGRSDTARPGLSRTEDYAVSSTVNLFLNKPYPTWLGDFDLELLVRVIRLPTENGQIWLLMTQAHEASGRLGCLSGKGGAR
jgi:hypothetical protein